MQIILIAALLFLVIPVSGLHAQSPALDTVTVPENNSGREFIVTDRTISPADTIRVPELPSIGKWMYEDDFQRAHWLGVPWRGKSLIEPINVIIVDSISQSPAEATDRLYENLKKAGYTDRNHHSSGYFGYIHRAFYAQVNRQKDHAFSNGSAVAANDHGRIFGPCMFDGKYYFTGAFSREGLDLVAHIKHYYESFNRARDEFSQSLDRRSDYKIARYVNLQNAILEDPECTTGDHDGIAAVLELVKGSEPLPVLKK